jgi:hypothetical protein
MVVGEDEGDSEVGVGRGVYDDDDEFVSSIALSCDVSEVSGVYSLSSLWEPVPVGFAVGLPESPADEEGVGS